MDSYQRRECGRLSERRGRDAPGPRGGQPNAQRVVVPDGDAQIMALPQSLEPISNAVHLSIDIQNLFAPGGIWETPWMERVLPIIVEIAEINPPRTVFTRFITPLRAEDRPGRWQRYFTKWDCATRSRLSSSQLEIVSPLSRLIPPATVIDKPAYSAFT